jgi:hypothetical protein
VLEELVATPTDSLHAYNARLVAGIASHLGMPTDIVSDPNRFAQLEAQARSETGMDIEAGVDRKTRRVLALCRQEGADRYINAIGGQALYGRENFRRHGIALSFLKTNDYTYPQFSDRFHPHLSIIDVLMHNGREGTRRLLEAYTLV